jgi:hypothetical protein
MPDDLLKALAFLMELTTRSQSVMWVLQMFRCVGDTVANSLPSLLADHALPYGAETATQALIEPFDATMADEVGALEQARALARKQLHALSSGFGDATLQTEEAAGAGNVRTRQMERILFGKTRAAGVDDKMLHLKYLCRIVNNLQRLTLGFEDICKDLFSPFVVDNPDTTDMTEGAAAAAGGGLLAASSVDELRKQWGEAWSFDDEHAVLRGEKNGVVLKTARSTRQRLLVEMGRLIVEADPGVMKLLLSVGEKEWQTERMMEQLLSEVNPQLNMIATWLDVAELHDVVGEVLGKLVQLYSGQLLDHKRWGEYFEDFPREEMAKCVTADAALLDTVFSELMADASGKESRKWRQLKVYVVERLHSVGKLMLAGEDGWLGVATETIDLYDAGRAARAQPVWLADESVPSCQICRAEFGVLLRRHHCRVSRSSSSLSSLAHLCCALLLLLTATLSLQADCSAVLQSLTALLTPSTF